jgi:hypothetical protein
MASARGRMFLLDRTLFQLFGPSANRPPSASPGNRVLVCRTVDGRRAHAASAVGSAARALREERSRVGGLADHPAASPPDGSVRESETDVGRWTVVVGLAGLLLWFWSHANVRRTERLAQRTLGFSCAPPRLSDRRNRLRAWCGAGAGRCVQMAKCESTL